MKNDNLFQSLLLDRDESNSNQHINSQFFHIYVARNRKKKLKSESDSNNARIVQKLFELKKLKHVNVIIS